MKQNILNSVEMAQFRRSEADLQAGRVIPHAQVEQMVNRDITTIQLTGPQWADVETELLSPRVEANVDVASYINTMVDMDDTDHQGVDFTAAEAAAVYEALECLGMVPDGEGE